MTMTQTIRKQATDEVLRKLAGLGYSVDAAGRRALEGRVDAAIKRHAEAQEVTIRKREESESQMETPIQKAERAHDHAAALAESITAYARIHGCSRAIALEKVLASPQVSEYVRLDRAFESAQREAAADREMRKLEGTAPDNHPINRSKPARTPVPVRPTEAGAVSRDDAPAATRPEGVMTADEVLQRLAELQQRRNPAMSRAQAVSAAAISAEFTAAHRAEKVRKFY
jgi:hypothetical protein